MARKIRKDITGPGLKKNLRKVPAQERLEKTSLVQDWQKDLARVGN
jgi:hypothetical protein